MFLNLNLTLNLSVFLFEKCESCTVHKFELITSQNPIKKKLKMKSLSNKILMIEFWGFISIWSLKLEKCWIIKSPNG